MQTGKAIYSAPTWRLPRWLAEPPAGTPDAIRQRLIAELFGSLPVFFGGLIATIVGPLTVVAFKPSLWFIVWLTVEAVISIGRLAVLTHGRLAARRGEKTCTNLHILMALAWSANLGFGCFLAILSGDWMIATVACVPAAAMVGGICFRNFAAPRLASAMIILSLLPMTFATVLTGEPAMIGVALLVPLFLVSMSLAAFQMNAMFVSAMVAEQDNRHRACHDDLTGLSNRAHFVTRLGQRLASAPPGGLALFFLDLDGFKRVNDQFGHATGDGLLQLVAEDLTAAVRADDITARLGGDEFVVLADGLDRAGALAFGRHLAETISRTYEVGGRACTIGVSIGIALAPDHGGDARNLLAAADAALYVAKDRGSCRVVMAEDAASPAPPLAPLADAGLALDPQRQSTPS
ncbi:MAG: GGDEF domain-containing protein [Phreatobacter sp.]|uniref:GGDEF domain-containing protein n=1 Tax=Phreatobacter sp. TaxID=1966341 RepID=UPI0027328D2F|nr:GGDEF domain-containing protein [Phreatobacter sp.]MDP2802802.1 GGDEF domain-containing protein [Phreatobacter sp.]